MAINVKIENISNDPKFVPVYQTKQSAGCDLRAYLPQEQMISIAPSEFKLVKTGLKIALPEGYEAQVRSRSGLAAKNGVFVLNSPGTIDSDYRGEIGVILCNLGRENFIIKHGDRIAQLVINRFTQVDFELSTELDKTDRDEGGFGSTGTE